MDHHIRIQMQTHRYMRTDMHECTHTPNIRMHLFTQATYGKTRIYRQKLRAYSTGIEDAYPDNCKCANIFACVFMVYLAQTKFFLFFENTLAYGTATFLDRPMCPAFKMHARYIVTRAQTALAWKYAWTARSSTLVSRIVYHVAAHPKHADRMIWN